jgi:DNA polymerase-1
LLKDKKLLLIDGHSLLYRAYYALERTAMTTSKGIKTWAVMGFINMLTGAIEGQKPDYLAISFDMSAPTVRLEQYEAYKGQREETPDDFKEQLPYVLKLVEALKIPMFEKEGYEADDCIATVTKRAEEEGANIYILSGDTDLFQLVSSQTHVLYPDRSAKELQCYDINAVKERYGLDPEQLIDFKALQGDASDNIPGVPGIGKVNATKLLKEFGNIEGIMSNLDKIKSDKIRHIMKENEQKAWDSRKLIKLYTELDLDINWEDCLLTEPDYDKLGELLSELEFKFYLQKYGITSRKNKEGEYKTLIVSTEDLLKFLIEDLKNASWMGLNCFSYRGPSLFKSLLGIGITTETKNYYIPFPYREYKYNRKAEISQGLLFDRLDEHKENSSLEPEYILENLKFCFENENLPKYGFDLKRVYIQLAGYGITLKGLAFDLQIAAFLLDSERPSPTLSYIVSRYLSIHIQEEEEILGKGKKSLSWQDLSMEKQAESSARITFYIKSLSDVLISSLKDLNLLSLFQDMEMPLVSVLARMEMRGITLDVDILKKLSLQVDEELKRLSAEIYSLSGENFNINSPKQLGEVLFDKLALPGGTKTKTGYSTASEILEPLREHCRIIDYILEYRELYKLKTTYLDVLPTLIDPITGKLHTSFNQTIAATGRLSSSNPNLQNIPVRTEFGRSIRRAFKPSNSENILLACDYSQIELRILAHYSGAERLVKAFLDGHDIHSETARDIFDLPPDTEPDPSMRRIAKTVNFGILYGISDFGLARNLGIDRKDAKKYIENYFNKLPGIKAYIENVTADAREKGYVMTVSGRRRNFTHLSSSNWNVRKAEERMAVNAPIQGSAADIIKLAMIKIDRDIEKRNFKSSMVLQIHDELVFDLPVKEFDEIIPVIKSHMEKSYELSVPMVADFKSGRDLYDMEKVII